MKNETQIVNLSMILTKDSLWEWPNFVAECYSAFDSMELSRIKASLPDKDEVLDYMVAKINEVVWDWETPPKVAEVLKEDLDDWMETFGLWFLV